jgi:hypothetical protein
VCDTQYDVTSIVLEEAGAKQMSQDDFAVAESVAMEVVEHQSPYVAITTNLPMTAFPTTVANMGITVPDDGRYKIPGVFHWFNLEAKAPIGAWPAIITPDDGRYDVSGVAEWVIEKEDDVKMGTVSLAEFVKELISQYPRRMSYSNKPVLALLVKFAYGEIASYGLEPQDSVCDIEKFFSSIMLQMRIPIGHTTV